MDSDLKKAVMKSVTPVNIETSNPDEAFYSPGISYSMTIPLFMFFNEHITNALDVNFSEEVHIDIELRSPSQLFYYGQLGDLNRLTGIAVSNIDKSAQAYDRAVDEKYRTWDQSQPFTSDTSIVDAVWYASGIHNMQQFALRHIQGIGAPASQISPVYWGIPPLEAGLLNSGNTFVFPNVDNNGDSPLIQFEANVDYIMQDTDAYRALRAQMFPEGTGLTTIVYDTAQETFTDLFASMNHSQNLLDISSRGEFVDPSQSPSGINTGDSTRYVDLSLKVNNLVFATHFMVRKMSDMGGTRTTTCLDPTADFGYINSTGEKPIGAHQIYTRALPVHYFQLLAAGRVIYESDGDTQLNLTQSGIYNGTGVDVNYEQDPGRAFNATGDTSGMPGSKPFNIYSINFGMQSSRLENTGALSYQNLNNPTLRIYFKPDLWTEHLHDVFGEGNATEADIAASLGVRVDVIHEFFNVVTINSGNGEITSGLNQ